jgi:hypothetical protein
MFGIWTGRIRDVLDFPSPQADPSAAVILANLSGPGL